MAGKKILLLLDDAASHDQVAPLLPGTAGSLVLVTSRRRLAALQDIAVISLDTLSPPEAAALLARLAARRGLHAGDAAVSELTRLCGYLPLAIAMIAGQLRHRPAWTATGLAADLAAARDRLALLHAENLSIAAAFDLSYQDLSPGPQQLFRRLGLVPGPTFDGYAAAALNDTGLEQAHRHLEELYEQHLVAEPAPGRYQLHDLLREHARALAAAGAPPDRDPAVERLLDYYLHTALAAGRYIASSRPNLDSLPPAQPPQCAPPLRTPGQAEAWLDTERANLQAAAVEAANELPRHAMLIPAALADFLELRGYWDQAIILHQAALAAARQVGDRAGQARALMLLSDMRFVTGDYPAATATAQQALTLFRDLGDPAGQGDALYSLGSVHLRTGHYPAAAASCQQGMELFRDAGGQRGQAAGLSRMSDVYCLTGNYPAARACAEQALGMFRNADDPLGEAWALSALGNVQTVTGDYQAAAASHQQAQNLFRDLGDPAEQAWALCQLGKLQRLGGDYPGAAATQHQALQLSRDLGERAGEGRALNELGLIQQQTGNYPAATTSHQQALRLFRDLSDPYSQAEVLNSLGELSSRISATGQARDQHGQALAIARDIGAPLEEARALEGTGTSHLHDGKPGQAAEYLRQALAIYQRIAAPGARRVQETLHQHGLTSTTRSQRLPAAKATGRARRSLDEAHQGQPSTEIAAE